MTVEETLLNGDELFLKDIDIFFGTWFFHKKLPIRISLKHNSRSKDEEIDFVNVEFYDRAINKMKHLKTYRTKKGLYFNAYGRRVYLNEMIKA